MVPYLHSNEIIINKKCQISNYIPHNKPKNINREKWHNSYKNAIIDIYKIIDNSLSTNFPSNNITWDNISINNLSILLYESSSKYISPYLEET